MVLSTGRPTMPLGQDPSPRQKLRARSHGYDSRRTVIWGRAGRESWTGWRRADSPGGDGSCLAVLPWHHPILRRCRWIQSWRVSVSFHQTIRPSTPRDRPGACPSGLPRCNGRFTRHPIRCNPCRLHASCSSNTNTHRFHCSHRHWCPRCCRCFHRCKRNIRNRHEVIMASKQRLGYWDLFSWMALLVEHHVHVCVQR